MNSLLKEKYYSDIDLRTGKLKLGSKYYLDHGWLFLNVEYKKHYVAARRIKNNLIREDEFEVIVKDYSQIVDCSMLGPSYVTVFREECNRSKLLISLQKAIDFGYKRFLRLAAFA